jgi:hypothetical protein
MLRKSSAAAAVIAFATAGSALFGGAALASDDGDTNTGGTGGAGGPATAYCVNSASQVPFLNHYKDSEGNVNQKNDCDPYGGAGAAGGTGAVYN